MGQIGVITIVINQIRRGFVHLIIMCTTLVGIIGNILKVSVEFYRKVLMGLF